MMKEQQEAATPRARGKGWKNLGKAVSVIESGEGESRKIHFKEMVGGGVALPGE